MRVSIIAVVPPTTLRLCAAMVAIMFGVIVAGTSPLQAASRPSALIAEWSRLNSDCRGGSGDDPKTTKACERRQTVGAKIHQAGWCYGKKDQLGYQYQWHACDGASLRPSS